VDVGDTVDLLRIVKELREDRMAMVQHSAQFKFAWQAVVDYSRKYRQQNRPSVIVSVDDYKMARNKSWRRTTLKGQPVYALADDDAARMHKDSHDKSTVEFLEAEQPASSSSSPDVRRRLMQAPLESQPWFRTGMSRQQVDEILVGAPEGTFVVRESSRRTANAPYALSVVHSGAVVHLSVFESAEKRGKQYTISREGGDKFPTIQELVLYFTTSPYAINESTGRKFLLRLNDTDPAVPHGFERKESAV
jgi:hypothetical protein